MSTNIEKTSELNEFVYPKYNPLGLVNDLRSDHKYRSNVLHNNKYKLLQVLSHEAMSLLFYLDLLMKPNKEDMISAVTFNLKKDRKPADSGVRSFFSTLLIKTYFSLKYFSEPAFKGTDIPSLADAFETTAATA